jgi:RNA polymerase sigma-70 factor (sigma-E family)
MKPSEEQDYLDFVSGKAVPLRRVAYVLCGDWHQAEDIVSVAITKLYVNWRRVRTVDNLDAYARQVVVRTFLDEQRRRWSRVRRYADPPEPAQSHPGGADAVDLRLTLVGALARVPPRQRAVLVLRYLTDLTVAETAQALDCSEGNVKSQTSHGLATLRRLLPDLDTSASRVDQGSWG